MSEYAGKDEITLRTMLDYADSYEKRREIRAAIRDVKKGNAHSTLISRIEPERRKSVTRSMTVTSVNAERRPSNAALERRASFAERRSSITDRRTSITDRRTSITDRRTSLDRCKRGSIFDPDHASQVKEHIRRNSIMNQYDGISDEAVLSRLLKEATELDERMKIRSALRKLRDGKLDNVQESAPKSARERYLEATGDGKPKDSKPLVRSHSVKARDHYTQIKDEKILENLLNQTNDYFERKKIRAALTQLRQRPTETSVAVVTPAEGGLIERVPSPPPVSRPATVRQEETPSWRPPIIARQHTLPHQSELVIQTPRPTINLKRTQSLKLSSLGRRNPVDIISQALNIRMATNGLLNGNGKCNGTAPVVQQEVIVEVKDVPIEPPAPRQPVELGTVEQARREITAALLKEDPKTFDDFDDKQATVSMEEETSSDSSEQGIGANDVIEYDNYLSGYPWDGEEEEEEEPQYEKAGNGGIMYIEDVQQNIKDLEKELDTCKDFDRRRELRANVREMRAQIREGKYSYRPPTMPGKSKSCQVKKNTAAHSPPKTPTFIRQESTELFQPKKEGESKTYQMQHDLPLENGGMRRVKMSVTKTRTPSQSDFYEKDMVVETETSTPGGTKMVEQKKTVTKTKLSKRGSNYFERASNTTRRVSGPAGSEVRETEISVEKDSSSVSQGKQTAEVAEMKFISIDNSVKLDTIMDKDEGPGEGVEKSGKTGQTTEETGQTTGDAGQTTDENVQVKMKEEDFTSSEESDEDLPAYPEISQFLESQTALDGTSATFECGVRLSQGSVAWYHGDNLLPHSDEFSQSFDGHKARLVIAEVYPEDQGEYRCVVKSPDGEAETMASLIVKANVELKMPTFSTTLTDCQAQDGDQVVLECTVSCKPTPTVSWYKADQLLKESSDFQLTFNPETGLAILSISEVFPDDAGVYKCVASNTAGKQQTSCTLTVAALPPEKLEAPTFVHSFSDIEARDEDKVVFECEISGSRPLEVTWLRNDMVKPKSNEFRQSFDGRIARLVIDDVYPEDSGIYKCCAKNAAGTHSVSGRLTVLEKVREEIAPGPPRFVRGLRSVTAVDGESACLECQVTGDPQPLIIWYKDGKILRAGVEFKQTYDGKVARLEISEVFPDDQGSYECVARSDKGKQRSACQLTVRDKSDTSSYEDTTDEADSQVSSTYSIMSKRLEDIEDDEELHALLNKTEDFEERKKIRARMREVSKAQAAKFEARRAATAATREDPIAMRQRQAEEARKKKQQLQADLEKTKKVATSGEDYKKQRYAEMEAEKKKKIADMNKLGSEMSKMYNVGTTDVLEEARKGKADEDSTFSSTKTEKGKDGSNLVTTTTTTRKTTKDGTSTTTQQSKTVTQTSGLGGTTYQVTKTSAEDTARRLANTFSNKADSETSGLIKVKTESWSSKDGVTNRSEKTQSWGGKGSKTGGPRSARAAFSQADAASAGGGKKVTIERSPSSIKQMLLDWCAHQVREYPNVSITNFSSCWNDGMAFCALIHRFYPRAFDFTKLNPKARRANFKLAFTVAEKAGGISPLLEVEDMVRMKNPDWKCVFTYIQMFYRKFREWDDSLSIEENQANCKEKF